MAELRMQLSPAEPGVLTLDIRKRRGGWPVTGIRLHIDETERPETLQARLSLWRRGRQRIAAMVGPLGGHALRRGVIDTATGGERHWDAIDGSIGGEVRWDAVDASGEMGAPSDKSADLPSSTDSRVPQVTH
jgi:hypothetical protein